MLGVLCSRSGIAKCISVLSGLIGPALRRNGDAAVFFTAPQPDLQDGYVQGIVTMGTLLHEGRVPIPEVVLNFARVRRTRGAKELRILDGHPDTYVVNPANRLNQLMVMEMLHSSAATSRFAAPYESVCSEDALASLQGRGDCVIIPESGTNLALVLRSGPDDLVAERSFDRMPSRLVILEVPGLSKNRSRLVVLRVHLQRSGHGQWRLLEQGLPKGSDNHVVQVAGEAALAIASRVGKFIPHLGICFVDLVLGPDGKPFFLHLGGWDPRLFADEDVLASAWQDMPVGFWDLELTGDRGRMYDSFSSNLLAYTALLAQEVA